MQDPTPPTITITAGVDQLAGVRAFVRAHVAAAGGDDETIADLVQAVDELVCNVVGHGYAGQPGSVAIAFIETPDDIAFRIRDDAPPFDPRSVPEPPLDLPLAQRRLGGMGIHLARTLTDGFDHRILPTGGNEVTVRKRRRVNTERQAMDITTDRPSPDVAVLGLTGELDGSNFEKVIDAGRVARDGGARRIVIDLSGLTYMGSSGLVAIHSIALLLRGQQPTSPEDGWQALHDLGTATAGDAEQGVVLAGPPPSIERVLDRSGMLGLFPVHADRASAVAAATTA